MPQLPPKHLSILGIHMQCMSYADMFRLFDEWLAEKSPRAHTLAVINVQTCVKALLDRDLRRLYNDADLVGIDSMPFLWLARVSGCRDADRFYAPDLLVEVSRVAASRGYTFFLYGGFPGAPDRIQTHLERQFGHIAVVGKLSPPFRELTQDEDRAVCDMINAAVPDFLWVGLGSPKQDRWIHEHRQRLRGCIVVPSGATFDFFSGRIRQAPRWIRSSGFEWLFRLTQDFGRLWKRYTLYNVFFLFAYALQLLRVLTFDGEGYARLFGRQTRFWN